jgi:hypothetical protein
MLAAVGPMTFAFGHMASATGAVIGAFTQKGIAMRALQAMFPILTASTHAQATAQVAIGTTATAATGAVSGLKIALAGLGVGIIAVGISMLVEKMMNLRSELEKTANPGGPLKNFVDSTGNVRMSAAEAQKALDGMGRSLSVLDRPIFVTADALKKTSEATEQASKSSDEYVKKLAAVRREVAALEPWQRANIRAGAELEETNEKIAESVKASEAAVRMYREQLEESEKKTRATTEATKQFNDAVREVGASMVPVAHMIREGWLGEISDEIGPAPKLLSDTSIQMRGLGGNILQVNEAGMGWAKANSLLDNLKQGTERSKFMFDSVRNLAKAFADLSQIVGSAGLGRFVQQIGEMVGSMGLAAEAGDKMHDSFVRIDEKETKIKQELPNLITGMISFAGSFLQVAKNANSAVAAIGGFATSMSFASTLGASAAGSVGVGLLGAGVGFAISKWQEMKRHTEQWREIQRISQKLVEEFNDLAEAGQSAIGIAQALGLSFREAISKTGIEQIEALNELIGDFKRELAEVNQEFSPLITQAQELGVILPASLRDSIGMLVDMGVIVGDNAAIFKEFFAEGEVNWKKMESLAEEFGISIDALGPKFTGAKLGDEAMRIITAFDTLKQSGANVGGVLVGMKDEIIKFVGASIEAGVKIPENFKPIIDSLLQSNQLTIDERNALEGLDDADFGPAIVSQFDKLISKIEELIGVLIGRLTPGLKNVETTGAGAGRAIADSFHNYAIPALRETEEAIRDVIEMKSPTGLQGIIYYGKLAGLKLREMADMGVPAVLDLVNSVFGLNLKFKEMGDVAIGASIRIGDAMTVAGSRIDAVIQKIGKVSDASVETITKEEDEQFAGFAKLPEIMSESEAIDYVNSVFSRFNMGAPDLGALAQAVGYQGGGRIAKKALQDFMVAFQREWLAQQIKGIQVLGRGGIVNAPTLAMIGERGPEAVVPLDKDGRSSRLFDEKRFARQVGEEVNRIMRHYDMTMRLVMRDAARGSI